jgi:hypothetical protein
MYKGSNVRSMYKCANAAVKVSLPSSSAEQGMFSRFGQLRWNISRNLLKLSGTGVTRVRLRRFALEYNRVGLDTLATHNLAQHSVFVLADVLLSTMIS